MHQVIKTLKDVSEQPLCGIAAFQKSGQPVPGWDVNPGPQHGSVLTNTTPTRQLFFCTMAAVQTDRSLSSRLVDNVALGQDLLPVGAIPSAHHTHTHHRRYPH